MFMYLGRMNLTFKPSGLTYDQYSSPEALSAISSSLGIDISLWYLKKRIYTLLSYRYCISAFAEYFLIRKGMENFIGNRHTGAESGKGKCAAM